MDNIPLSELFHIKGRYRRSIHLERDFYAENVLEGYILTTTAREMLSRIIATLEYEDMSKAWSLTGPYGSGKSAFALYAAKLLGPIDSPTTQQAIEKLKNSDTSLYERFINLNINGCKDSSGYCPVLISGERAPISIALLRGLDRGISNANGSHLSLSLRQEISHLLEKTSKDIFPSVSDVTHLFESATDQICDAGGAGVLLIIDELGKFFEFAVQHTSQGDMFILQSLAELADRSNPTPLFLLTILHQVFEAYAVRTAQSQREEWTKVQGRFEDVVFAESTEQVLRLVGSALEKSTEMDFRDSIDIPKEMGIKPRHLEDIEYTKLLGDCLPLHPTVTLFIGPFFRRFAQNERSLFAFLSSSEPNGLQDFLSQQYYDGNLLPMYTLADLYDYLDATQGNELFTSSSGKKWAEIEAAIMQLSDPSDMTLKLIKTIGLLGIVREAIPNLKASEQFLRYALGDDSEEFDAEFSTALATLKRRSIVTYRRHNNVYVLWEGSDIDIEEKLREAASHVDTKAALASDLSQFIPARPLVARRHLHQTGTLRYFTIRYTDLENFDENLTAPIDDADGLILYALPANEYEVTQLTEKARSTTLVDRQEVLIAIPRSIGFLAEVVTQLAQLHWVTENTPELSDDAIARREISIRLKLVEQDVSMRLAEIFNANDKEMCIWYNKGQPTNIDSERARNNFLSIICDEIYYKTPIIRNELVNRRKISGVSTSARKKLIQAMLENGEKENLGIEGYPPEMSIYRSLLWDSGIHRNDSGAWGFYPPDEEDNNRLHHTWQAIEEFLNECENMRQPVEDLYAHLMRRPYGVRSGPLPILLCAVILHYRAEIALYENGSFVADMSVPVFERLQKAPEQFELKRFRMAEIRVDLFSRFLKLLNQPIETDNPDLLTIVTPLMRSYAQLPHYTQKTQELSDAAKNFREVVEKASEPDEMLFKELPQALGFSSFGTEVSNPQSVTCFFNKLQDVLSELSGAYDRLLNSLERMLADAFNLDVSKDELRTKMATRAEPLLEVVIETQLKGFLIHLYSEWHDFKGWIESLGTFLAKKPPASWVDTDKVEFEISLSQLVRKFRHFESVFYEKIKHPSSTGDTIRIGITTPNEQEHERVVFLPEREGNRLKSLEHNILRLFDEYKLDDNANLKLGVLARISKKIMQDSEKK